MKNDMTIQVLPRAPESAMYEGNGVVRHYFKQWAVITTDGLPQAFEFSTDEPLPAGPAALDPRSFSIVSGRLQVSRVKLVSLVSVDVPKTSPAAARTSA